MAPPCWRSRIGRDNSTAPMGSPESLPLQPRRRPAVQILQNALTCKSQCRMLPSMSMHTASPQLNASLELNGAADSADDAEPAEKYIGNRIADEDEPSGPDEVE